MVTIKMTAEKHHPDNRVALSQFESLIGLDVQKRTMLVNLKLIFQKSSISEWKNKHHSKGLPFYDLNFSLPPLIILYGDVGCGKTELASCIGSTLSEELDGLPVKLYKAPSDIRGTGHVGELSALITSTFDQVINNTKHNEASIFVIDEADGLVNSREDEQQHHEDRAGVNAMIKEIDRVEKCGKDIAIILITNRIEALDPAITRRSAVQINFERPQGIALKETIEFLVSGTGADEKEISRLQGICEKKKPLFTSSDLFKRVAYQAVLSAFQSDEPFDSTKLGELMLSTSPSPQFKHHGKN